MDNDMDLKIRELQNEINSLKFQLKEEQSNNELLKKENYYMKVELGEDKKSILNQKKELESQRLELRQKYNELLEREIAVDKAINSKLEKLDSDFFERKRNIEAEISQEKKNKLEELNNLFEKEREERIIKLDEYISNLRQKQEVLLNKEREERINQLNDFLDKEKSYSLNLLNQEIEKKKLEIDSQIKLIQNEKNDLENQLEDLELKQREVERNKRRLERKENQLDEREEELDEIVIDKIKQKILSYESNIKSIEDECESLRAQLKNATDDINRFESVKVAYGEDPAILIKRMQELLESNRSLSEELAIRPSKDIEEKYHALQIEREKLKSENTNLIEQNKDLLKLYENANLIEIENRNLISNNKNLESHIKVLEKTCDDLHYRIDRLSSIDGRLVDRDERISEIKRGYFEEIFNSSKNQPDDEIDWLEQIKNSCTSYGISFPERILYSFHTALKISDWSSITVLAGVSGTGKSELPRLYCAFGGLNFINVPVQPNWDSQESMLGFFNSIDNRFDAQPLLRFLVQCTEDDVYNDYMSVVLLDEMNLAHVEHYFAEFLSKLETRRGLGENNIPTVEVKLGAGVEPYHLKLAKTILWTGTMNQDETTKSLSDKVLDRGIMINFPRPTKLNRRQNMEPIEAVIKRMNRPMLTKNSWNSWIVKKIDFIDEQKDEIMRFKGVIESINDALEGVGRALGHRVWQSIEYYIANYPSVIKYKKQASDGELTVELKHAMKIAFEDQIVQKVMPKLRGIETRGKGEEQLEYIKEILENEGFEKLKYDFEIACEQGHGQFMWRSAKYIEA